ncbi:EG45-like domain containing protein 2 [Platanthera guangdongensis]|uniref:EG45-like domain containing protein 2 n=1 Tax=Platanthera guangdongensis TaxID=2320717 RepID=A0ABR2M2U2_9ASPA
MIAAASEAIWDNKAACGRHYRVRCKHTQNDGSSLCKDKSVIVMITDFCPPGSCHGTIDLSQEAFNMIAHPAAGVVHIEFTE